MSREPETNASRGDSEAKPFPKAAQLARGERRYRRRVASPKQWQAIAAEKHGPCRVCCVPAKNGGHSRGELIELHHLVKRGAPYFGDDVADNIVPLCRTCHEKVTTGGSTFSGGLYVPTRSILAACLTDAEYAYLIGKLGEGALERLYRTGR